MKFKPRRIFKDRHGRVVVFQWPNVPLYGWIVFKILAIIVAKGKLKDGLEQLSVALLFVWSYLEIKQGVNYFRRILGVVVLLAIVASYFK